MNDISQTKSEISKLTEKLLSLMEQEQKRLDKQMLDEKNILEKEKQALLEKSNEFKVIEKKLSTLSKDVKSKIKLNIGGKIFTTKLETLIHVPTFFSAMFSEHFNTKPDEDGEYFIDRDPKVFSYILNYLRDPTREIDLKELEDKHLMKRFEDEVDFYQIQGLLEVIKANVVCKGDQLQIQAMSRNKIRVSKNAQSDGWAGIMFSKCSKWRVTMIQGNNSIMFGVADSKFLPNGSNYDKNGWYVYNANGSLYGVGISGKHFGTSFTNNGDVAEFEFKNGELLVTIKGTFYSVAHRGLAPDLFPAVDVHFANAIFDFEKLE